MSQLPQINAQYSNESFYLNMMQFSYKQSNENLFWVKKMLMEQMY